MLKFHDNQPASGVRELVLLWTSSTGARCVLVGARDGMELHLTRDGMVVRRMADIDPRLVRDIARQWRLDYEMEQGDAPAITRCPECGDDMPVRVERGTTLG